MRARLRDATRYGIPAPTRSIVAYDLDADSRPDILAAIPGTSALAVLMNRGDGFHVAPAIPLPHATELVKFADVNGDAVNEILAIGRSHVCTLFANGNGTFRVVSNSLDVVLDVLTASRVATGDLTGDGKLDLIGPGALLHEHAVARHPSPEGDLLRRRTPHPRGLSRHRHRGDGGSRDRTAATLGAEIARRYGLRHVGRAKARSYIGAARPARRRSAAPARP